MNKTFFHKPDHTGRMPDCCFQLLRCLRILPALIVVSVASLCTALHADEAKASKPSDNESNESLNIQMRQAGIGRFRPDHWGMVKGQIGNASDRPATSLTVVTPAGSEGLQFARELTLPAKVVFESSWPVYVREAKASGGVEFEYLFFPDGQDDGVIRRDSHSSEIPSFQGMTQIDLLPLCGLLGDTGLDIEADTPVYDLMGVMRFAAMANKGVTSINSAEITADPECLDALDQIAVTNPELASFPQSCDALRAWVLRGGRLLIATLICIFC